MGDRFGKGIRTAPRDALIADSPPRNSGRAFGFHRGMDHLGAAVGRCCRFLWFYPGQLRLLFLMTLLPGLFVLALLVAGLHEKPPATQSAERMSMDASAVRQPLPVVSAGPGRVHLGEFEPMPFCWSAE